MFTRQKFEVEYARLFKDYGYGSTIWSPLASGLLTGKYNNGIPEGSRGNLPGYEWLHDQLTNQNAIEKVRQLQVVAASLGVTTAQMALAWCLKNPNVSSVITGASRVEQVHENMKAMAAVEKLTPDVMQKIEGIIGSNDPVKDE
jgi:aryl-alcohol dehydrogenase-like predicted oxidoreductase